MSNPGHDSRGPVPALTRNDLCLQVCPRHQMGSTSCTAGSDSRVPKSQYLKHQSVGLADWLADWGRKRRE